MNNTALPELQEVPEAIDAIIQYKMIMKSPNYNKTELDNEDNLFLTTMLYCEQRESIALKNQGNISSFYAKEGIRKLV